MNGLMLSRRKSLCPSVPLNRRIFNDPVQIIAIMSVKRVKAGAFRWEGLGVGAREIFLSPNRQG